MMDWTKEKPTRSGPYWFSENGHEPEIVEVSIDDDSSCGQSIVWYIGNNNWWNLDLHEGSSWMGPLDMPELSK